DAARAYQAVLELAASAQATVPALKARLKPAAPVDPARLARLVADLNHDKFKERERATKELEALGELAAPALRKALATGPSAETKQRATQLLLRFEIPVTAAELLRSVRAIEVLERIGNPEARQLLQSLAKGADEARLTWEAKAALKRLPK